MDIADFIPQLLVDAPECPDATARQAIVASAIELCRDGLAWVVVQDPVALIDGQPEYDIEAPDDAVPFAVLDAWLPQGRMVSKTMGEIALLVPDWRAATAATPSYYNNLPGSLAVRLFPIPMNANRAQLTLRVAFAPVFAATTLPDALVNDHNEVILNGARARLFKQPRKPWTDLVTASAEMLLFTNGKVNARIKSIHDGTPGSIRTRAPAFGF